MEPPPSRSPEKMLFRQKLITRSLELIDGVGSQRGSQAASMSVDNQGEATHCRNCDSLAVVAVAHLDPHLAGRHLAAIGRADDCFCRL